MKIKDIKKGQKFKPYFTKVVFLLTKIEKEYIEFVNIKTGEIHKTTKNDQTEFNLI